MRVKRSPKKNFSSTELNTIKYGYFRHYIILFSLNLLNMLIGQEDYNTETEKQEFYPLNILTG